MAVLIVALTVPPIRAAQGVQNIVVTSAASFQAGLPPPGSIATIFCAGLSVQGLITATDLPLPYTLAGVTVTVGGLPAPLFAVAELAGYQQINLQVPDFTIGAEGGYQVVVQQGGSQGTATVNLSNSPGDFFRIPGTQVGIFQHAANYSLVTVGNPATPGEILVTYLTGVPTGTSPTVPIGQPASVRPLAVVNQLNNGTLVSTYNVVVNGVPIGGTADPSAIPFFGLTPGLVGLYQINFALPSGLTSGDAQIELQETVCEPPFGQCIAQWIKTSDSSSVLLPVR